MDEQTRKNIELVKKARWKKSKGKITGDKNAPPITANDFTSSYQNLPYPYCCDSNFANR